MIPLLKHFVTAIRDFKHMGSLMPSSKYAGRAVARHLPTDAKLVVEYGPGTGIITRQLLKALPPEGQLTAVEINERFLPILKAIDDKRVAVLLGEVLESISEIRKRHPEGVDAVVSGIPFSLIRPGNRDRIVAETRDLLKQGGRFIAYQNSRSLIPLFRKHFGNVSSYLELRNLPPYYILVAEK